MWGSAHTSLCAATQYLFQNLASCVKRYIRFSSAALSAVEPFGVETFGRLGFHALALLRAARRRVAERLPRSQRWVSACLHARWLGQLSVALQGGLFDAAQGTWGALGAPGGGVELACAPSQVAVWLRCW